MVALGERVVALVRRCPHCPRRGLFPKRGASAPRFFKTLRAWAETSWFLDEVYLSDGSDRELPNACGWGHAPTSSTSIMMRYYVWPHIEKPSKTDSSKRLER